jgi:hypothetical protein
MATNFPVFLSEGMDWTKKQDFKLLQNVTCQLLIVYPFLGECRTFHTGMAFNLMASMLRKLLPASLKNKFLTGLTFPGGRLNKFYLMPDVDTANKRIMSRLEETLKRRYNNEEVFKL